MSRGKNRYAIAWDLDPDIPSYGEVTKTTTTMPQPGVRFHLVEAQADQAPTGGHHDGAAADQQVTVDDASVRKDSAG